MNYKMREPIQQQPILSKYQASNPYPAIEIESKNMRYAQLLSIDLASSKSEMSCVNQYIYESWTLRAEYPEIAEAVKQIGIVEMHHFYLIGEMITQLGKRPRLQAFKQNRNIIWNGNMLHYAEKARQLMRYNILLEKDAIATYAAHAQIIKDGNIAQILERIIADEEIHLHVFEDFLAQL